MAEERVRARGVEVVGPLGPEPAGIIVSLIGADGTRSMLTDRGAGPLLAAADLQAGLARGRALAARLRLRADGRAGARRGAWQAAARVRAQGGRVSVDLASVAAIEEAGRACVPAPRCRMPAGDRVRHAGGAAYDPQPAPLVVAKRGAAGAGLRGTDEVDRPSLAAEVIDPTGAGDALAGGMLAALLRGAQPAAALEAGLDAAARCVGRRGAMPGLR